MSDVPLGAFLSGGVDSSAIVATMSRLTNRPVATCSIGFEEKEYDEADYARAVAKQFSTDHYEKVIRPDATRVVDRLAWHFDEPFADSSAIPTYYVSAVARERVTVALGGDGGDENFAGYRRYVFDQIENRLRSFVPLGLRKTVFGPLGNAYPALAWAPRVFRAKATLQSLARTPLEGYFNSVSIFRPAEKARIFTPEFRAALGDYDSIQVFREHYDRAGTDDLLSRIQYVDIKTYLADDILTKVDRASMAVSLEVRAPILDHVFMELVARLPSSLKLRGGETKYIFKKALSPFLSNDVLHRPKQGFAIPLDRWFRSELKESAYETIFGLPDDVLDLGFIRKMWDQHQKKVYDRSAHLWAVLMYRKWQKAFLNGTPA
jgi:asparagine synthase (glutamine-hydrolysing)